MEKMNSGRYSEGEDLEPNEIYVKVLFLHASVLKKDFEKGVGYRLTMFKTLMVSQRDFYLFELDFEMSESCVSI